MGFWLRLPAGMAVLLAVAAPLWAQGPQADSSLPLFTVMAAVNAATEGFRPYSSPLSAQLRRDLEGKKLPSAEELRRFLAANRTSDPLRDYSRYVSFALVIDGPPDFGLKVRESEIPEDARALDGLNPLLAAFYAEAGLDKLWDKYRPAYDKEEAIYQESIARVILEVNGYLRSPTSGYLGRSFAVYVDLLGPPNQVNSRSFGVDYYLVVTPSAQPQLEEVRHGYLHYVLEPLAAKYSALLREKDKLLETAKRAPALDAALRGSFQLFLSESLIRAVELRMTPHSGAAEDEKQGRLEEAGTEGYFLAPYFFEALQKFEQQDGGIRLYYPTLIQKLDVRREERRAEQIAFRETPARRMLSEQRGGALRKAGTGAPGDATGDDAERLLAEGEDAIARKDFGAARDAYRAALETSSTSARARALYGLALVATQEKQPEVAKNYFQQTLETAREPQLLAWSHIYLGRLLDMENKRDLALRHYRQAMESGEVTSSARLAAQRGIEAPFKRE